VQVQHHNEHILGVISDTHGLVRAEALEALAGVEQILHAGDVGALEVLAALARIAPVVAVRGNNDEGPWAKRLRQTETITIVGVRILMLHDVKELRVDPGAAGVSAVIAGHSHRPAVEERGGVLFFNPGSAGPRRFKLPVAVGKLYVAPGSVRAEIVRVG
jgi:putative phosphoesterase